MQIYIYGTGEHSRKIYQCALLLGHQVLAFIDHHSGHHKVIQNAQVIDIQSSHSITENKNLFIAVGNNELRKNITTSFADLGWNIVTLIHPTAYISEAVKLGDGVFVGANATIETGSLIGPGTIVDIGVVIDHDSTVGDYLHLKPGTVLQCKTSI